MVFVFEMSSLQKCALVSWLEEGDHNLRMLTLSFLGSKMAELIFVEIVNNEHRDLFLLLF